MPFHRLNQFLLRLSLGITLGLLAGCQATQNLASDELLVQNQPSFKGNEILADDELKGVIRTHRNSRWVLPKVKLHLWQLGVTLERDSSFLKRWYLALDKEGKLLENIARTLKAGGEEPLLVDTAQIRRDARSIKRHYFANGFFDTRVRWRVSPKTISPKKADVRFEVDEGRAHRIRKLRFRADDSLVQRLLENNRRYALLKPGQRYDESLLAEERNRIAELLRNRGFYRFSSAQVSYVVDTTIPQHRKNWRQKTDIGKGQSVSLFQNLLSRDPKARWFDLEVVIPGEWKRFQVRDIRVNISQQVGDTARWVRLVPDSITAAERARLDVPRRRLRPDIPMVFYTTPRILSILNLTTVAEQILQEPGSYYSRERTQATQRRLQQIGIFRNVLLDYEPNDSLGTVDLTVNLNLLDRYNIRFGVESFQSEDVRLNANVPGVGANLELNKRNAFKRGEQLNFNNNGSISFFRPGGDESLDVFASYGLSGEVSFPRLWGLEKRAREWENLYSPSTNLSLNIEFDRPRQFTRTSATLELNYKWFHNFDQPRWRSVVTPVRMTIIDSELQPGFLENVLAVEDTSLAAFIRRDFQSRFSSFVGYSIQRSDNYANDRTRITSFFQLGVQTGGNLAFFLDWLGKQTGFGDGSLRDGVLSGDQIYGQFYRLSAEGKVHIPLGPGSELVNRVFMGFALPWNFTTVVPFENRFFSGGPSSVRGWLTNTLGPGTFPTQRTTLTASGGEIKFEANTELRFDMVSFLEGALFLDAGNVWFSGKNNLDDPRTRLSGKTLSLGIAGGFGLRFDFSFVVVRLDLGQQLFDPALDQPVIQDFPSDLGGDRLQYNIAIGYPF